jgi:hypothetical protein
MVTIELEDGSIEEIPYREACYTQSFAEYCEKLTIGKELSPPREELTQYASEQNPAGKQSIKEKMLTWTDEEQVELNDRRFITAHHWNNATWSIHRKQETLPKELRNVEPPTPRGYSGKDLSQNNRSRNSSTGKPQRQEDEKIYHIAEPVQVTTVHHKRRQYPRVIQDHGPYHDGQMHSARRHPYSIELVESPTTLFIYIPTIYIYLLTTMEQYYERQRGTRTEIN